MVVAVWLLAGCAPKPPVNSDPREPDPQEVAAALAADGGLEAAVARWSDSVDLQRRLQDARRATLPAGAFLTLYEGAARARPDDARAWYLLGRALLEIRPESAAEPLARAIELAPTDPWPVLALAHLARLRGDRFSTVQALRAGVDRAPRSALLRRQLAAEYVALQLWVEADRHATIARRLAPDDAEALALWGRAQIGLGRSEAGLAAMREAIARGAASPTRYVDLARVLLDAGRVAEADAAYQRSLEAGGEADDGLETDLRVGRILHPEG